jgi:hypothetical protein
MPRRKIRDATDARRCLDAAEASGLHRVEWARRHGVNARSLNAWRVNLERGAAPEPLRLLELVSSAQPAAGRYVVHVGEVSVEVDDDFREDTLARLLRVVLAC